MDQGPMEILKQELESDQLYIRVNTIHRMSIVAAVLGVDGVKGQLIPYIEQLMKKEEDEVLYAIAKELSIIAKTLGSQQTIVIPFLEQLAASEETVVRERAVESLIGISDSLTDSDIVNQYVPMVLRLAANESNFTCRISAVHLMVNIYPRAGSTKEKIRQKFSELCSEETPMVRRTVATLIGQFATVIEKEYVISDLIGSVKQLISDDQDQVRVLGLNSLKLVAKVLSKEENKQLTLQIIIAATEDRSWRVRLSLSTIFADLAEAFGKEVADVSLIQIFTNLLRDAENEVRQASINSLAKFVKIVSAQRLVIILPHLQYLAKDSVPQIRAGTCKVIGIMSGLLQNKEMVIQKLMPHLQELFNDENKEVKESVMKASSDFCINLGVETIQQFIPLFKQTLNDDKSQQQWRVRIEVFRALIKIAVMFPNNDLFQSKLEELLLKYLKDKTASVRHEVSEDISQVVQKYKDWTVQRFIPKLEDILNKEKEYYLYRAVALNTLKVICKTLHSDPCVDKILVIFYKHLNDIVPNIRLQIIKAFQEIIPRIESQQVRNDIRNQLNQLSSDQDKDVKYYVGEALAQLK